MKKLLFFLAAAMLLGVSCQQHEGFNEVSNDDVVSVQLKLDIPELAATRAGETDMNSGLGAIDNFNDDEWAKYDVRYILEIYDVTPSHENLDTPIKKREVQTFDSYQETMFEVRLVPNRKYRFVVWADFVMQGTDTDLNYNTADLKSITRNSIAAMDESHDAYFIWKDLEVTSSGISESLTLKRPFGKIRVITTDQNEVNIGSEVAQVDVTFYNHTLYNSLNAVTGVATGDTLNSYTYTVTKDDSVYTQGYDESIANMTLFADYILAGDETEGAQEVNFTITAWGKDGREINSHDFNTQIPLERNHLTTIVGNLLTLQNEIYISIDDNFDGEYLRNYEEETLAVESWGIGELNEYGNYEYALSDGTHSFTLIVPSSSVNPANGKLWTGDMKYVASEAELVNWDNFTIEGLTVDPTRAEFVEPTIVGGSMQVSDLYEGGSEIYINLEYTLDPTAETPVYETISFLFSGDAAAKTFLAYPTVEAKVVDNTITLTWDAVEGAEKYSITTGTEMPVITEELSYTFTGEYGAVYTFVVTAIPADEELYYEASTEINVPIGSGIETLTSASINVPYDWSDMYVILSNEEGTEVQFNFYYCTSVNYIPEGEYPVSKSGNAVYPEDAGTFYSYILKDGIQYGIHEGYVNVSEVDGKYHFDINVTSSDGIALEAVFEGDIEGLVVPSQYVEPEQPAGEPRTIYVTVDADMPELYFYSWVYDDWGNPITITAGWPGDLMTQDGSGVFHFTYPAEYDGKSVNFIFNNGHGSQTEDLTNVLTEDLYYERYDIVVPQVANPDVDSQYSVIGKLAGGAEWSYDIYFPVDSDGDGVYVVKGVKFDNGNEFKIRQDGNWIVNWGNANDTDLALNTHASLVNDGYNLKVADVSYDKAYDIYFDTNNWQAWVTEGEAVEPEPEPEVIPEFVIPGEGVAYTYDYRYTKLVNGLDANNSIRVKQDNDWIWEIKFNPGLSEIVAGDYTAVQYFTTTDALEVDTFNGGFQNNDYNYVYPDEFEKVTTFNVQVQGEYYCITLIGSGGYGSKAGETYRCVYIGKIYN